MVALNATHAVALQQESTTYWAKTTEQAESPADGRRWELSADVKRALDVLDTSAKKLEADWAVLRDFAAEVKKAADDAQVLAVNAREHARAERRKEIELAKNAWAVGHPDAAAKLAAREAANLKAKIAKFTAQLAALGVK